MTTPVIPFPSPAERILREARKYAARLPVFPRPPTRPSGPGRAA